ncbi:MAG TPA: type VI secretion system contractile sheath small subunit [Chthoniobacterales bacterium]|jgi:type VI secretion system protein ImpB|nr:type VI secretion system contractile sheath small subunit [Chthoniobacterales bacterium]
MAKASSQKFIARNRAPRVQIEYDVEVYGAQKKIELPFVMGVMADLSGKPADPLAPVAERKFLEFDIDNFDDRLKATRPRVAFSVPNTLTGQGNLSLDITFESLEDFSPGAVARKVESLNKLLTARNQLANLITYMDGKTGAEELVKKLLAEPALLNALASAPKPESAAAASESAK